MILGIFVFFCFYLFLEILFFFSVSEEIKFFDFEEERENFIELFGIVFFMVYLILVIEKE